MQSNFQMRKQQAVFCSDVTDFCPVCGQRQTGISVFACVLSCLVTSVLLTVYGHHAVMLTLKQKTVLVSLSIHHEQGIHQLVARRLKRR